MVHTNYECWASVEGFTNSCGITIQHTQLRSQVDHFNPSALNIRCIAQPENCFTQRNASNEISAKTVSQISSNGYYGFTYVNVDDNVAENGSDVNTHFGKHEAKRHNILGRNSVNHIKTFATTTVPNSKKRVRADENCTNKLDISAKRCRLETEKLPVLEPTGNMDVDVTEFDKDANNLYGAANSHMMFTQNIPICPPNNLKNYYIEKSASYGLMHSRAQITARISALRSNKSPEVFCSLSRPANKRSRMYDGKGTSQEISCYDKNKRHLEQMFSETHGSGVFYLGLDEGSLNCL